MFLAGRIKYKRDAYEAGITMGLLRGIVCAGALRSRVGNDKKRARPSRKTAGELLSGRSPFRK